MTLTYLADRDVGSDAAALVADIARDRLADPAARITLERQPRTLGLVAFESRGGALTRDSRRLLDAAKPHAVDWRWVRGHSGDTMNERADQLATEAREGLGG